MIDFYNLIGEQESSYVSTIDIIVEELNTFKLDEMSIITESDNNGNIFKRLWNKFIHWIKNIWIKIKNFFRKILRKNDDLEPEITDESIVNKRESDIGKIIQKYISENHYDAIEFEISRIIDLTKYRLSSEESLSMNLKKLYEYYNTVFNQPIPEKMKIKGIPSKEYAEALEVEVYGAISIKSDISNPPPASGIYSYTNIQEAFGYYNSILGSNFIEDSVQIIEYISQNKYTENKDWIDGCITDISTMINNNLNTKRDVHYIPRIDYFHSKNIFQSSIDHIKYKLYVKYNNLFYKFITKYYDGILEKMNKIKDFDNKLKENADGSISYMNIDDIVKVLMQFYNIIFKQITDNTAYLTKNLTLKYESKFYETSIKEIDEYNNKSKQGVYVDDNRILKPTAKKIVAEYLKQ